MKPICQGTVLKREIYEQKACFRKLQSVCKIVYLYFLPVITVLGFCSKATLIRSIGSFGERTL